MKSKLAIIATAAILVMSLLGVPLVVLPAQQQENRTALQNPESDFGGAAEIVEQGSDIRNNDTDNNQTQSSVADNNINKQQIENYFLSIPGVNGVSVHDKYINVYLEEDYEDS